MMKKVLLGLCLTVVEGFKVLIDHRGYRIHHGGYSLLEINESRSKRELVQTESELNHVDAEAFLNGVYGSPTQSMS